MVRKKVYSFAGAHPNEKDDIRKLLSDNNIIYFETPRENFGFDSSGIWVNNKKDYAKAIQLIEAYFKNRAQSEMKESDQKSLKERILDPVSLLMILTILILGWMYFMGYWQR